MNVEETVTNTATNAASVEATITAAAETLLVAFVGWKKGTSLEATMTGWTEKRQLRAPSGFGWALFWKYNATAGDVTATAEFAISGTPENVDETFIYVSEISGADKLDSSYETSDTSDATIMTNIAISREGNIALQYAVVKTGSMSEVTPPTGHSTIADDDGTGWCMFGYWIAAPYAAAYLPVTTLSTPRDWSAAAAECDLTITQAAMLGSDF